MSSTEVDLEALHEAIKATIRGAFPNSQVPTVDYYARPGEKVVAPAIFFELESIEPDTPQDTGAEQLKVVLSFSAYVVVSSMSKRSAQIAVRVLAARLAGVVRAQQWALNGKTQAVHPAQLGGIEPAEFIERSGKEAPNLSYYTWRVPWSHEALIGDDSEEAGVLPSEVFLGAVPQVGPPHVGDYQQIVPQA